MLGPARAVCVWRAQAIHDVPIAVAVLSPIFACQREAITQVKISHFMAAE